MPASRDRSRSPRRSSGTSYTKDKTVKSNSREASTVKTEVKKESANNSTSKAEESTNKTNSSSTKDSKDSSKPAEKNYRKPYESPASKGGNAGNWNSSLKTKERKFSGRCRLFVGNLLSCEDNELREMFEKYGEVAEVFINKEKGFGFVRLVSSEAKEIP